MDMTEIELLHDLRMPLQLIQSSAQMIGAALEDSSLDVRMYLDMLNASAGQMRRMLDGVMADCKRDARVEPPRLRRVDAAACLRTLCLRCRAHADLCGVALRCTGNVAALTVATDEDLLSRIVLNLIANALQATPRGGHVEVRLTALGDCFEVSVEDDGAGIDPERLPYVFLRGETGDGFGFGLSAARDCARWLGGELSAASEPGRGSVFTLRLPVREQLAS